MSHPAWKRLLVLLLLAGAMSCLSVARAATPLHRDILVFVPAYEGSQLFNPKLGDDPSDPICVWGCYNVFFSAKRYFALRMPNPLEARPMLAVGPIDIYRKFISTMSAPVVAEPSFTPYTPGADFFTFTYDWRQEIATVSAPQFGAALENYARIHESKTGIPARETKFIIVAHSMGGLVARTWLAEHPGLASRVSRLYLVGTPNAGSVKAAHTLVIGPDTIDDYARGFPGALLDAFPNDVDAHVTKLVGITRPSLYELLPLGDPHWTAIQPDGERRRMSADDVLRAAVWEPYWPSAELEKRLFLDGWLKDRAQKEDKPINPAPWKFCQDPNYGKLKTILAQVAHWRGIMGRLSATDQLLTRAGGPSRLRVVFSTGLLTPTGVVSHGEHDAALADLIYESKDAGDGTVEGTRVLDDMTESSLAAEHLHNVAHGKLMIDPHFLAYFTHELANEPTLK
jgi:hypothetical protein